MFVRIYGTICVSIEGLSYKLISIFSDMEGFNFKGEIIMALLNLIEEYVNLVVKKQNLEKIIEDCNRNIIYARHKGDTAFANKNYELEKAYNMSVRDSKEKKYKSASTLININNKLNNIHQIYLQTVTSMSDKDLVETINIISRKVCTLGSELSILETKKEEASKNSEVAYANKNYELEYKYNDISKECYKEMEKTISVLSCYKSFITDLKFRVDKQPEAIPVGLSK